MKKIYMILLCLVFLSSCEKVWVEDLKEQAYDSIRGKYEIESAVWEGAEPVDIDGDGTASFDYLAEWESVWSGGPGWHSVSNERGSLYIPYTIDDNADWGGPPKIARRNREFRFNIQAVVEGGKSHLEFELPEDEECEFEHSGYGVITLRTNITFTVLAGSEETKDITGPVLLKYVRTEYRSE